MSIIGISGKIGSGKDTVTNIIQYLTYCKDDSSYQEFVNRYVNDYPKDIKHVFEIKRFADTLKDYVCMATNCSREQLEDREFKEKELGEEWWFYQSKINNTLYSYTDHNNTNIGNNEFFQLVKPSRRTLLQLIGTEAMRDIIHPNYWVNCLISQYKGKETNVTTSFYGNSRREDKYESNWLIPDTRFPNELKAIKDRGGIVIRVNRPLESVLNESLESSKNGVRKDAKYKRELLEHPSETALDNAEFDYIVFNDGSIEDLIIKVKEILLDLKLI